MKLKNLFLGALALVGILAACEQVEEIPEVKITSDETSFELGPQAADTVVTFTSATDWQIKGLEDWITVTPAEGAGSAKEQTITIKVDANPGIDREATITIYASKQAKRSISITQKGDAGDGTETVTVAKFIEEGAKSENSGKRYRLENVTVTGKYSYTSSGTTKYSYYVKDETGNILVYNFASGNTVAAADVEDGGIMTLTGVYEYYENSTDSSKNKHELTQAIVEKYEAPAPVDPSTYETVTVAEFIEKGAKNTETRYRLKDVYVTGWYSYTNKSGVVGYSYNVTDETGSILVYNFDTKNTKDAKDVKDRARVTLTGIYVYYDGGGDATKAKHELTKAIIEEYNDPEAADPTKIETITVAQFLEKKSTVTYYRLEGTVSNFNSTYCSFDLTDATGKVNVYNVTDETKTKYASVIKNGGKVKVYGLYKYYNSTAEMVSAVVESFEAAAVVNAEFTGNVVAVSTYGILVQTTDGYKYVFDKDITVTVKVGDNVTVKAEETTYLNLKEYENYTVTVNSSATYTQPTATELTATAFDSYATAFGYVKFSGKLTISNSYYNVEVTGASCKGSLSCPVNVADTLNGKIVDVEGYYLQQTGSSTKYQEFMATSIKYSADQTGADSGSGDSGSGDSSSVSLTPGENEVLYTLTNDEIVSVCYVASATSTTYGAGSITSKSGTWAGNFASGKDAKFLQLRNSAGAYISTPAFSSKVVRVVIAVREGATPSTSAQSRKLFAVPTVDAAALLASYPTKDKKYTLDTMSGNYGKIEFDLSKLTATPTNYEISFASVDVKSFSILAYGGACYIDSIYVFCAK